MTFKSTIHNSFGYLYTHSICGYIDHITSVAFPHYYFPELGVLDNVLFKSDNHEFITFPSLVNYNPFGTNNYLV